jgi:hypothetical protein
VGYDDDIELGPIPEQRRRRDLPRFDGPSFA